MTAPRATNGGNRTRPCTAIYRALMEVFERRRLELGLPMNTNEFCHLSGGRRRVGLNELTGAADGYYAKMIYPDTPSGRQARWETVDEFATALFGSGYSIQIVPGELTRLVSTAIATFPDASSNARNVRHWRHRRHFQDLSRKAAEARAKIPKKKWSAICRKGAKKRWKRVRAARRQGDAHKAANAEKGV